MRVPRNRFDSVFLAHSVPLLASHGARVTELLTPPAFSYRGVRALVRAPHTHTRTRASVFIALQFLVFKCFIERTLFYFQPKTRFLSHKNVKLDFGAQVQGECEEQTTGSKQHADTGFFFC